MVEYLIRGVIKKRSRIINLYLQFRCNPSKEFRRLLSLVDAVTLSGILKAKQKLGVTFNSDKLGGIDFTKFSKLSNEHVQCTLQKFTI